MNFYKILKLINFSEFLRSHCLMHSVKCSRKLAKGTALLLLQKYLEFCGKKLSQYQMPACITRKKYTNKCTKIWNFQYL